MVKKRLHPIIFTSQKSVTDIFTININRGVFSDRASCDIRKDCRYIIGYYEDGETIIPLYIKIPKNILSYGVS